MALAGLLQGRHRDDGASSSLAPYFFRHCSINSSRVMGLPSTRAMIVARCSVGRRAGGDGVPDSPSRPSGSPRRRRPSPRGRPPAPPPRPFSSWSWTSSSTRLPPGPGRPPRPPRRLPPGPLRMATRPGLWTPPARTARPRLRTGRHGRRDRPDGRRQPAAGQPGPEPLATACQPALDRADRPAQPPGRLLVGQALDQAAARRPRETAPAAGRALPGGLPRGHPDSCHGPTPVPARPPSVRASAASARPTGEHAVRWAV